MAAADHKLRVNGVYGLPISGALIMPVVVSGNRNTPATMIGETASALVLGAAQ
jgi:choline dehydrogenase-like flavoprotein